MSNNEMEVRIQKLLEWEALAEEAKAEADMLRDEIKCEMMDRGTEELMAGRFIVRWTSVLSNSRCPLTTKSIAKAVTILLQKEGL